MEYVITILCFSVFIRRFIPAHGFLCDSVIEYTTRFGSNQSKIKSSDEKIDVEKMIAPVKQQQNKPVQKTISQQRNSESRKLKNEGVDLSDIKAKQYKEVNTDYIFSNIDASEENLTSVVKKGLGEKQV